MAEITNIMNPSPHKFDPLGELIALVQPLVDKLGDIDHDGADRPRGDVDFT